MAENRMTELLIAAAATFGDGCNPFETSWLIEHRVTSEECFTLSEQIAHAIRNWARLDNQEKSLAVIRAGVDDPDERETMLHYMRLSQVAKNLGREPKGSK
jgi:hypothetical protein